MVVIEVVLVVGGGWCWTMDKSQFIVNAQSWVEGSIVDVSMISSYYIVGGQGNNLHNSRLGMTVTTPIRNWCKDFLHCPPVTETCSCLSRPCQAGVGAILLLFEIE